MKSTEQASQSRLHAEQTYLDNLFGTALEPMQQPVVVPEHPDPASINRQQPFDCQLIMAAGLKLALPVASFSQVLTGLADIDVTRISNVLLAGRVHHDGNAVDVIDLASVVMAEQNRTAGSSADAGVILLLHDACTGLLCERLLQRITVSPDRLCWRESHSRHTWLAATARSEGFALLDIEGIKDLLQQAAGADGPHLRGEPT